MANALYFGDNLEVLRESTKDESVDLIYLDPPFNSNATYNVLFKTPKGHQSDAQIEAFDDTWHWGEQAEAAFADLMQQANTDVAEVTRALRSVLGENDMMAYLAMMAIRLLELRRVLRPTGSLYLHCDPTASHYLKIVMDQVFGPENFCSEIIWRRSGSHNKLSRQFGPIHDTILYYSKSADATFHPPATPYTRSYIEGEFRFNDDRGRYRLNEIMGPGERNGDSGLPWHGYDPTPRARHWAIPATLKAELPDGGARMTTQQQLDALLDKAFIVLSSSGRPKYKQYPHEGVPLQDIWAYQPGTANTLFGTDHEIDSDVKWLDNEIEKLGYPTQKPVGLLQRIIETGSDPGAVVLDPFCGCGTAVHAAQKMGRQWIGIDITHLAISLIEKRLRDAFPDIIFDVYGTPKDIDGARNLAERDKYQFQWWACSLVNAQPFQGKKKGADTGIDGIIYFQDDDTLPKKIVVSVKGGENVSVAMVRDFAHVIDREKAAMGLFVTLTDPTKNMVTEGFGTGYYTSPFTGTKFPKLQVLTIEGLLAGTEQARYPRMDAGGLTFKKAKREEGQAEQKKLL